MQDEKLQVFDWLFNEVIYPWIVANPKIAIPILLIYFCLVMIYLKFWFWTIEPKKLAFWRKWIVILHTILWIIICFHYSLYYYDIILIKHK